MSYESYLLEYLIRKEYGSHTLAKLRIDYQKMMNKIGDELIEDRD